jgi:magnesium transporter
MLTILKNTEQGLQVLDKFVNGCWVNVIDPTPEEIIQLEEWGVFPEYVQYSLDLDEMSRSERDEDYVFILLRIPYYNGAASDIPYTSIPMGILVFNNFVVTICRSDNDINRILCNGKYRGLRTAKRYRFVLYALLETATRYLAHLREINKTIEIIEDRLQASTKNKELLELLKYHKSLTYFTTALRSNELMMERLQRMQMFNQYEEDQELLEDVLTENQQAIQMASIYAEILSGLMDAFASIISNNVNDIMKTLAVLTIVLNMPLIIASLYGMNVALPGQESGLAFIMILVISAVFSLTAVLILYKRRWF